jgi:hypothetical protein
VIWSRGKVCRRDSLYHITNVITSCAKYHSNYTLIIPYLGLLTKHDKYIYIYIGQTNNYFNKAQQYRTNRNINNFLKKEELLLSCLFFNQGLNCPYKHMLHYSIINNNPCY